MRLIFPPDATVAEISKALQARGYRLAVRRLRLVAIPAR